MTRTVGCFVGGTWRDDHPGGRLASVNPARVDETTAEALLGDAATFVEACHVAREAQRAWAGVPAPVRGQVVARIGRLVEWPPS
jgi:acyl-CoA reductase-like NAD-dependent aldehyde dehydrogenase